MSRDKQQAAYVPVGRITVHPHNIRRDLGDLQPLQDSIRRRGVMVPLILEQRGDPAVERAMLATNHEEERILSTIQAASSTVEKGHRTTISEPIQDALFELVSA